MCAAGWGNCNGMDGDGCEADLQTSEDHCGTCGTACATNAGTVSNTCTTGACVPDCQPGYNDCDTSRANGCECHGSCSGGSCV
jgi:hypothetical protein